MTYPSFAAGDVLTATDMNAVGLWKIKQQTVGSAVSSVTLTNVFSSDYENYRVVISGVDASSAGGYLGVQFGAATTTYYGSLFYDLYTGTNNGYGRSNNGASILCCILGGENDTNTTFDVLSPNLTKYTTANGTFHGGSYSGWFAGSLANTTAYTDMKILCSAGTLTGGEIRVYGYRN